MGTHPDDNGSLLPLTNNVSLVPSQNETNNTLNSVSCMPDSLTGTDNIIDVMGDIYIDHMPKPVKCSRNNCACTATGGKALLNNVLVDNTPDNAVPEHCSDKNLHINSCSPHDCLIHDHSEGHAG